MAAQGFSMIQTGNYGGANGLPGTTGPTATPYSSQVLTSTDLSGGGRDAVSGLLQLFNQYGLGTLGPKIVEYVKQGFGTDTIALLLQDTDEWKKRFVGNEARKKKGLPVLSPSEYLATERSYAQVLQQFGLPGGFYDSPSDFADFIGRDLSPSELQSRAQIAANWANSDDPDAIKAAQQLYGFGVGDRAAYALNPDRALPLLQKQANAIQIASAALHQGLGTSKITAENLTDRGVTSDQAEQGYSQIAQMLPTFNELGHIYHDSYTQATAEADVFLGDADAVKKRKSLASQERAAFSGSSKGSAGRSSQSY